MLSEMLQNDVDTVSRIAAVPAILDVICRTTGMGFAAVARVTDGHWVACRVLDTIGFGLKAGGELKLETTICHEIRQSGEGVIIDHVAEDAMFRDHPTPKLYGFQSYISLPITLKDGTFFGTLCAIDPNPARVNTPEVVSMFKLFAELIAFHISALDSIELGESRLREERVASELREQFIAVLGHDLRNPLGAISTAAHLLNKTQTDERSKTLSAMIQDCVVRMTGLIENILDFALGRLGSGLPINREESAQLEPVLQQVIEEHKLSYPGRAIEAHFAVQHAVHCDPKRIGQILANLLGNALKYGSPDFPVRVTASAGEKTFELSVANGGKPIAPEAIGRLFQPFTRGGDTTKQGLGLGLYIAEEIARAHNGELSVTSTEAETRFTLRMPV